MKIAIAGKGGVGKTTILALIAKELQEIGKEILLIDADPSPHMAQTLGFHNIADLTPIAKMTKLLKERAGTTEGSSLYNINPQVNDLLHDFMITNGQMKMMVLGAIQKADGGCACPESNVLKRLLTKLLLSKSQAILLDMEAGVEHLGRGTIASVDELFVVVIPSNSSIRTAIAVYNLGLEAGIKNISFIGNLVEDNDDQDFLNNGLPKYPVAYFPNSKAIRKSERSGQSLLAMTDNESKQAAKLIIAYMEDR